MMPKGGWTPESVTEQLADLFADDSDFAGTSLIDAAAVLASFDPDTLAPFGEPPDDIEAARADVRHHSSPFHEADGSTAWILERDVRRKALARLVPAGTVRAALDANPGRIQSEVQHTLERALLEPGARPLLARPSQVRAWQIVADWVRGIVPGVPDETALRLAADRAVQLAPFRDLVGDYFAGRERELAMLSDYVGVRAASGAIESAWRVVRAVLSLVAEPPLFVCGPGGIGKSTLIGRFILDHVDRPDVPQFPYAYLDFDRPGLVAEEPVTLLIETLRQLSAQYPSHRHSLDLLRQEWGHRIKGMASDQAQVWTPPAPLAEVEPRHTAAPDSTKASVEAGGRASPTTTAVADARPARFESLWSQLRLSDRGYFLETFAQEVRQLQATSSQPMLFVLDTFEEVQLRSAAHVIEVFGFLDQLQALLPFMRTVLCGRVAPDGVALRPLRLETFDIESATAFITARVRISREGAETVARQITGSPLTLKLAVDLLRRAHDTPGGLSNLQAVLGELKKGSVEAQLYTRVIEHITDEDVRRLAYPGLLLRRITPGIIQYVLAAPCDLEVPDRAAATRLLDKLRREVVLVSERSPEVLVHRPELRAVMLKPLQDADPDRAHAVNRAAVAFYQSQPADPETRAEELYHRLWLGHDRATLDGRWLDGVEQYLVSGVADLPPRAQGWLAGRMTLAVTPDVWRLAELEDWERFARRELRELLRLGNLDAATALLGLRATFSDPALKVLQVETLVRTGQIEAAQTVAAETLARVPPESEEARALQKHLASLAPHAGSSSGSSPQPPAPSGLRSVTRGSPSDGAGSAPGAGWQFVQAMGACLSDAYPKRHDLAAMLRHFGLEALLGDQAQELIDRRESAALVSVVASRAASAGQMATLMLAARRGQARNGRLWALADTMGVMARGMVDVLDVQKSVLPDRRQHEVREVLTRLEAQVCHVRAGGETPAYCTGFLVGPDLVLTSPAILADASLKEGSSGEARLRVTFDAAVTDTGIDMPGVEVGVTPEWLVASGGEALGYLLIRLAEPMGETPGADGGRRGWMPLQWRVDPARASAVATFRFDSRGALVFSASPSGMRERDTTGMRLQYEIDGEGGGSGSPVFDSELRVVALHVARASGWLAGLAGRRLREGTALDHILQDLGGRGITLPPPNPPLA